MNKSRLLVFFGILNILLCGFQANVYARRRKSKKVKKHKLVKKDKAITKMRPIEPVNVIKRTLSNGMTILVVPNHSIPMVYLQIWYNVGSKDEENGEKGIAHLIEHMIFKGTEKLLSESDINVLVHKLSGSTNAFTSYDFTGYRFDMPTHHWRKMLPIFADCMRGAAFKDDHLNSEMKAVIQELKMGKDNFFRYLAFDMLTTIFSDHPYHYPIIGYKQDLWSVTGDDLKKFYHKHYVPNNATLVIVGDVQADEAVQLAEQEFGAIEPDPSYTKREFYHNKDIASKSVTIYRDVKQPQQLLAWVLPGSNKKQDHIFDIMSLVLGSGKASRLYRKIVDEEQLATSLSSFALELFEHSLFFIAYEPTKLENTEKINEIIHAEIADIVQNGFKDGELVRAVKNARMKYYGMLENMQQQAYLLGKYYTATGDEQYAYNYLNQPYEQLEPAVRALLKQYMRPTVMHSGAVMPLPESEKEHWMRLQQESDALDKQILTARARDSAIEAPRYAQTISAEDPQAFDYPEAQSFVTKNGIKVLYYNNTNTPKISVALKLKARSYFEPVDKPGLYRFVASMLDEGTKNYSATELATELEQRGMSLNSSPGMIAMNMLSDDIVTGLEFMREVLTNATFPRKEVEKVREQLLTDIKNFWDEPRSFAGQLVKEELYKGHPYSKRTLGTPEMVAKINRKDLEKLYKEFYTPHQATLVVVGDLRGIDVPAVIEKQLGNWQGPEVADIEFPELQQVQTQEKYHPINRDQVVLALARLSIDRKHPDYDKLWIFDQILGGGALGSLHSRLFQLREQSGLFYSIGGSLIAGASEQPGMVSVRTLVSLDRLQEAELAIKQTLRTAVDLLTQEEFIQARRAIVNSLVHHFESNSQMASAFLFLERYNFPANYFDTKAADLTNITLDQVKEAVRKVLDADNLFTLKVGRSVVR